MGRKSDVATSWTDAFCIHFSDYIKLSSKGILVKNNWWGEMESTDPSSPCISTTDMYKHLSFTLCYHKSKLSHHLVVYKWFLPMIIHTHERLISAALYTQVRPIERPRKVWTWRLNVSLAICWIFWQTNFVL